MLRNTYPLGFAAVQVQLAAMPADKCGIYSPRVRCRAEVPAGRPRRVEEEYRSNGPCLSGGLGLSDATSSCSAPNRSSATLTA